MIKYQFDSEKVQLLVPIFRNLDKWGITELPVLEKGHLKVIHTSSDKTIQIIFESTGYKQGCFLLRQKSPAGSIYHLKSEQFIYE